MESVTKEYSEIELTTEVFTASQHRLIQLMLDKCLKHIATAKIHMTEKNIIKKCEAITKAMNIVRYLRVCLNLRDENTKELATLLSSIYEYLERTLLHANMYNDPALLDEAKNRLKDIKNGWDNISEEVRPNGS